MINIKKILVPIDFSETAELSLRYAASFAMEFGSQIHLLHVIEEEAMHPGNLEDPLHTMERWEKEAAEKLAALAARDQYKSLEISHAVRGGLTYETIIDEAQAKGVDLIIIGAHGESGFVDAWLGGTSYEVARKAPCPVLTVKATAHGFVQP
ncbi:MAG: Universal stress protein family [Candidatus Ozemobacter sibiricus]|jgi:nucleotide-binding universal stress UspA family protein|uniref:Universal stress protein n=1 Tax=Candidatus Ozemobacter sibiricus TaxID=2268124 RepID=A0A367ZSE5_9BACT|nr:MAG: Universal stress protein family [Candidatus Ozemobacter sibiricus]